MASSSKRLQNDVSGYELSSDRKIAPTLYYIVCVRLENATEGTALIKKLIRTEFGGDGMPLAAYTYSKDVYFLFSSLDNSGDSTLEHFMGGSHHKICSYYASTISRDRDMNVWCSIIELDSRTKVLIYFQTKIYDNARNAVLMLLNSKKVKIAKKDFEALSMSEMLEMLKANKITWNEVPAIERFGTFYKYVVKDAVKPKLSTMSELIDVTDLDKYTNYLFH